MHEVDFFRLQEGRTADDVRRWRKERGQIPLPATALGGALDSHDLSRVLWLRREFKSRPLCFALPDAGRAHGAQAR